MVPDQRRAKIDPKAEAHIFVGVAKNAKAWQYYNAKSRHVQVSHNITFEEADSKLFPIPDEYDSIEETAPLEGENDTHERQLGIELTL